MSERRKGNQTSKVLAFDRDVDEIAAELEGLAQALRDGAIDAIFFVFQRRAGVLGTNWLIEKDGSYLQFLGWLTLHFWRFTERMREEWRDNDAGG